tara:strand:- start:62 stop:790 length:729 start_codon:yes stop_codon:yes gene_type:complete
MKTPLFIVSDNHFQRPSTTLEKKRRQRFYSLLDHIKSNGGTLIIGGDFFDFWFEYRGYIPTQFIEIFERLKDLKNHGIEIYYILGNHDYWDFGFFNKIFSTKTFRKECHINVDNQKILIMHGDGILKNDYNYRIFRKIIRSKFCVFLFNLLPPRTGYWIASKVSNADKPAEYYKDNELIKKKIEGYAQKKWKEIDVLLIGHYHQSGIIDNNNNKLIFLGDWLNKFLVTIYDDNTWKQVMWDK